GLYHEAAGNWDEAISAFKQAIRLNTQANIQSPWPLLNLGLLMMRLDRLEEAETQFRASLKVNETFPPAHYRLGQALEKLGRIDDAKAELERAVTLDPTYPDPHYALARIHRRKGDTKSAGSELKAFQSLRDADKRNGTVRPE